MDADDTMQLLADRLETENCTLYTNSTTSSMDLAQYINEFCTKVQQYNIVDPCGRWSECEQCKSSFPECWILSL